MQSFRAFLKTLLYLGRTVAAIVCDVRSHWCVCEMVYIAVNTELKKKTLYIFLQLTFMRFIYIFSHLVCAKLH